MSINLSHFQNFSSSNETLECIGIVDKEAIHLTEEKLSDIQKITVRNINRFLRNTTHLGEEKLKRPELLFLLLVNNSYAYEYSLDSKEQEKHHPTSRELRRYYKCSLTQRASKCDKLRMGLEDRGYIETEPTINNSRKVKFSEKFFLTYQIWSLSELKASLLETTLLSKMSSETINKIKSIESTLIEKYALLEKYQEASLPAVTAPERV